MVHLSIPAILSIVAGIVAATDGLSYCTNMQVYCGWELVNGNYIPALDAIMDQAMIRAGIDPRLKYDTLFLCNRDQSPELQVREYCTGSCAPANNNGNTFHCE